jgi:hypothetical protein
MLEANGRQIGASAFGLNEWALSGVDCDHGVAARSQRSGQNAD